MDAKGNTSRVPTRQRRRSITGAAKNAWKATFRRTTRGRTMKGNNAQQDLDSADASSDPSERWRTTSAPPVPSVTSMEDAYMLYDQPRESDVSELSDTSYYGLRRRSYNGGAGGQLPESVSEGRRFPWKIKGMQRHGSQPRLSEHSLPLSPRMSAATKRPHEIAEENAAIRRNMMRSRAERDQATEERSLSLAQEFSLDSINEEHGAVARIGLQKHVHSEWCDRKDRICSAAGKLREGEVLVAHGLGESAASGQWMRIDRRTRAARPIPSAPKGSKTYQLQKEDVGCRIAYHVNIEDISGAVDNNGSSTLHGTVFDVDMGMAYFRPVGPIEAMPPSIRYLSIEGACEVGSKLAATYRYRGGYEGPTQVWWLRVHPDGSRERICKPMSISVGRGPEEEAENPLHYLIQPGDVGCTLKVKCRAIRLDGVEGTVTTSQPSETIVLRSEGMVPPLKPSQAATASGKNSPS